MKRLSIHLILWMATLLLPFLASACSDDDADPAAQGAEVLSTCLSYSTGFVMAGDEASAYTVSLQWDDTEWTLTPDEGDILLSVSPQQGGARGESGSTPITLTVAANPTQSVRVQDLIARDRYGHVRRFVVRQDAFSRWVTVTVDDAERYQQVVGFGGMCNPYIWTSSNQLSNSDIDKLYSPTQGLGYTILRLMIYPDQSAWSKDASLALRAQKLGATVFACPWYCDEAWTDSVTVNGSVRKHLRPERYADYAQHLCDFVTYMEKKGIHLYGITVQNEPDGTFVYWTREELAAFIRTYGPQIRRTGVRLMAPEPEGVSLSYLRAMVDDPDVFAQVDVVATHTYTGYIGDAADCIARRQYLTDLFVSQLRPAGKEWWMTEHLFNEGQNAESEDGQLYRRWDYSLTTLAREVHDCMTTHCSAYVYWYLKRFYGLLGDNDSRSPVASGEVTANGYILAHYAQYASGSVRVAATTSGADGLTVTAYHVSDTERTLVLTNTGTEACPVSIGGTYATRSEAVVTTETARLQSLATRTLSGRVYVTLPAMSIASVRCIAE